MVRRIRIRYRVLYHQSVFRPSQSAQTSSIQIKEDLVTTFQKIISGSTLALFVAASFAVAGNKQNTDEAKEVANAAIAQLAGWQNQAARKTLQAKKAKFGNTPEFKTAWALLETQEAAGSEKSAATAGAKSMSQIAKGANADPAALYWEAELLYQQSKNKEALAAWQATSTRAAEIVNADPTDATAQFYLGASLVRQKKYDPALKALRLAVRGGFDEAMVNQQIGFIYLYQQKWQEAKNAFDVGLSVNPRFAPMYYWRAMAWDKLGRKDNLLLDLDQFVKLAPNAPEAGKAKAILSSAK